VDQEGGEDEDQEPNTTDPSSFQVPPLRSMRTMRRICRNRRLRSADNNVLPVILLGGTLWSRQSTEETRRIAP
ncbi:hypothetical protein JZ751_026892, partial [Albula glossodonta]